MTRLYIWVVRGWQRPEAPCGYRRPRLVIYTWMPKGVEHKASVTVRGLPHLTRFVPLAITKQYLRAIADGPTVHSPQ